MCEALASMEFIRNAEQYLSRPTQATNRAEEEGREETLRGRMTLQEKTALMGLLREVVSGGGEIEEREELMRGIEGVISEGRERGDSEGMLAEEEGERLLWVIEKKKRGRDMKNRREIEREKAEEKKNREEAERRESEEKNRREEAERRETEEKNKKEEEAKMRVDAERRETEERKRREELEREIDRMKTEMKNGIFSIRDVSETVVKVPNREVTIQKGNRFHNNTLKSETVIIGNKMSSV